MPYVPVAGSSFIETGSVYFTFTDISKDAFVRNILLITSASFSSFALYMLSSSHEIFIILPEISTIPLYTILNSSMFSSFKISSILSLYSFQKFPGVYCDDKLKLS